MFVAVTLNDSQREVTLRIHGDPDGTGSREGVFVMRVGADAPMTVQHSIESQYFIDGRGGAILSLFNEIFHPAKSKDQQIFLDFGGSIHRIEIDFQGFDGSSFRWGDTGNGGTDTDATGDTALEQVHVLINWLTSVRIDSFSDPLEGSLADEEGGGPAKLEFGLYHPDGPLPPLEVVPENPTMSYAGNAPGSFDGSLSFIHAGDINNPVDIVVNDGG